MAKIILLTNPKGGAGKSTISYNLAINLKDSAKVCIVDMDKQGALLSISGLSKVPIFSSEELNQVVDSDFDFIFVDTPSYPNENISELSNIADVIIIPIKGTLDLLAIKSTIDIIKVHGNEDKAIVVFNMIQPNTSSIDEVKDQLKEYDIKVSKNMLSDLVAFSGSVPINGVQGNNNAQKQIDSLTNEILNLSKILPAK